MALRLTQKEFDIMKILLKDMQTVSIQTTTQSEVPWSANCKQWTIIGYMWKLCHGDRSIHNIGQTIQNMMDMGDAVCIDTYNEDLVTAPTNQGIAKVLQLIDNNMRYVEIYEPLTP